MNLLFIVADQFRADHLSCLGHPAIHTPHLDRLATQGVCFTNHWANASPCGPSRACLLTGTYMSQHRSVRNGFPIAQGIGNLAQDLQGLGFMPTVFGYTSTSPDPGSITFGQSEWHSYHHLLPGFCEGIHLRDAMLNWRAWMNQHGFPLDGTGEALWRPDRRNEREGDAPTLAPTQFPDHLSETSFLTQAAIQHIHHASRPWACHVAYIRPHPPYIAPEPWNTAANPHALPPLERSATARDNDALHPYLALHRRRLRNDGWCIDTELDPASLDGADCDQLRATYGGMVMQVDAAVGQLLSALEDSGQYNETLIVFTSDHGEMLGEHWLLGKDGFYDAAYHIPLIIRDPRQPRARGRRVDAITESVDVLPTIIGALGGSRRFECDGRSLKPWISGTTPPDWRRAAVWNYDFRDPRRRRFEQTLGLPSEACNLAVWREERWKLVHFSGTMPPLLFDLHQDPHETNNRANDANCQSELLRCIDGLCSHQRTHAHRGYTRWYAHSDGPIDCLDG